MKHGLALVGVAAVGAVVVAVGVALDADAFVSNILAELAGLALGVIVAVILADYLVEQRRKARWTTVAAITAAAIDERLGSVTHRVLELSMLPAVEDRALLLEQNTGRALGYIAEGIRAHAHEWAAMPPKAQRDRPGLTEDEKDFSSSERLHYVIQADTHYIRDVLAPRALELAVDHRLVELLLELERTERAWAEGVRLVIDDWGYPEEYAWSDAARYFDAASRLGLYLERYLVKRDRQQTLESATNAAMTVGDSDQPTR